MNRERRKRLKQASDQIEEAVRIIEEVRDEEQDSHDNLPESLMDGERGERMEQAIEYLEDALSDLESAIENIDSASN